MFCVRSQRRIIPLTSEAYSHNTCYVKSHYRAGRRRAMVPVPSLAASSRTVRQRRTFSSVWRPTGASSSWWRPKDTNRTWCCALRALSGIFQTLGGTPCPVWALSRLSLVQEVFLADFFSVRFGKNVWITSHARSRMADRSVDESALQQVIEEGQVKRKTPSTAGSLSI
jgi:hypothetical protein